jgi:hypothetical protein
MNWNHMRVYALTQRVFFKLGNHGGGQTASGSAAVGALAA